MRAAPPPRRPRRRRLPPGRLDDADPDYRQGGSQSGEQDSQHGQPVRAVPERIAVHGGPDRVRLDLRAHMSPAPLVGVACRSWRLAPLPDHDDLAAQAEWPGRHRAAPSRTGRRRRSPARRDSRSRRCRRGTPSVAAACRSRARQRRPRGSRGPTVRAGSRVIVPSAAVVRLAAPRARAPGRGSHRLRARRYGRTRSLWLVASVAPPAAPIASYSARSCLRISGALRELHVVDDLLRSLRVQAIDHACVEGARERPLPERADRLVVDPHDHDVRARLRHVPKPEASGDRRALERVECSVIWARPVSEAAAAKRHGQCGEAPRPRPSRDAVAARVRPPRRCRSHRTRAR